jgi:hypothetical protein
MVVRRKGYQQSEEHVRRRMASRLATLAVKPKPASREWLVCEYVEKRRNCVEIGAELGRDPKTIWEWLRHYEIPTRPRGGKSSPGSFQPGQPGTFAGKKHTAASREAIRAARKADGGVPYLRNGQHWLKTVAREDHPSWQGGITPERQEFYATQEWRDVSRKVWERSGGRCESCDELRTAHRDTPFHIHHIVRFRVRHLRAVLGNLVLLCPDCHRWVHSRKNVNREYLREA